MKKWLDENLKKLNLTDVIPHPEGFTRLSFTKEEWKSREVFKEIARALGLLIREDEAGNVIARWNATKEQEQAPAIALGSHVDTVASGGGYDGVAGVLCALGAIKKLKDQDFKPAHPIEAICFVSEESARFGVSTIGSKAMAGLLDLEALKSVTDKNGVTVQEAVESYGLRYEEMEKAARTKEELLSFVELHIEQGVRVEDAGADYGAVTAIACPIRLVVEIEGKAGHTGTTPMDKRKDAFLIASKLALFINERANYWNTQGEYPIVATASTVEVGPNVMNVIPGKATLGVDIRSVDDQLKATLAEEIRTQCQSLMEQEHVIIRVNTLVNNRSIHLDPVVYQDLANIGDKVGLTCLTLESGAGHDVMNMQTKWPSGLIFIRCRDGLSHHPDEYASLEDLEKGVNLLSAYLDKKAGEQYEHTLRGSGTS
ncbi:M20 family metallo-hydrolase [Halalkalibacter okhensis]|uniref:M20 family metallo-hydrolase n=1 Tax=Halalkalibacter okhensis TaxID=333138 RepID=UPI00068F0286|nr:M20 family metallo-hydrolase [Halalkalibacter okhensis]